MEGKYYITQEGIEVKIICEDKPNNMVYAEYPHAEKKWVGKVDYEKWQPKYYYVPDMPEEEIISPLKTEENAIQIGEPEAIPLAETPIDSGTLEQGIPQSEEPTKESEDTGKEEVVKKKRNYTKKVK